MLALYQGGSNEGRNQVTPVLMQIHAMVTLTVTEMWIRMIKQSFMQILGEAKTTTSALRVREEIGVVISEEGFFSVFLFSFSPSVDH